MASVLRHEEVRENTDYGDLSRSEDEESDSPIESDEDSISEEMREFARQHGMSPKEYSAHVAGGKVVTFLMDRDHGECVLRGSIYDAALVMPQICRSSGWPKSLSVIAVRCYFFLMLNLCLQGFVLYMIVQEEQVMDKFAGQMYLCDFGAWVETCPDGPNCIGPSGTNYQNAGRMYSYDAWATRTYVRDALKTLFPEKAEEINKSIDPGEYGLENYHCRLVCVFIFIMFVLSDLRSTLDMVYICWFVPSEAEPWLEYRVPSWDTKERVKQVLDASELDFVTFKLAGMPLRWKIINIALIIVPKFWLWRMTTRGGITFLMETAGIESVIINVTALTFILNLDEMIFELFSHKCVHHILEKMEPYHINDSPEDQTSEEAFKALRKDSKRRCRCDLFPYRLVLAVVLTVAFIWEYYATHCMASPRGGTVSQPVSLPMSELYPVLSFILPMWFPPEEQPNPFWNFGTQADDISG